MNLLAFYAHFEVTWTERIIITWIFRIPRRAEWRAVLPRLSASAPAAASPPVINTEIVVLLLFDGIFTVQTTSFWKHFVFFLIIIPNQNLKKAHFLFDPAGEPFRLFLLGLDRQLRSVFCQTSHDKVKTLFLKLKALFSWKHYFDTDLLTFYEHLNFVYTQASLLRRCGGPIQVGRGRPPLRLRSRAPCDVSCSAAAPAL